MNKKYIAMAKFFLLGLINKSIDEEAEKIQFVVILNIKYFSNNNIIKKLQLINNILNVNYLNN